MLPELNDEFAKSFDAESLEKLQTGVREDLEAIKRAKLTAMCVTS